MSKKTSAPAAFASFAISLLYTPAFAKNNTWREPEETGKEIGITELEKEENKEDNNLSFDSIDVTSKKNDDNSKINSVQVVEPEEETFETEELEEEIEEDFDEEEIEFDEMKGDEE